MDVQIIAQESTINEERQWCVYIHTNKINNKAYIGITNNIKRRWGINGRGYLAKNPDGSYHQPLFANAINKYNDWENDWDHYIFADNLTQDDAKRIEVLLIALYKTNGLKYRNPDYGYNMTDGGDGMSGYICSDETKHRISESKKGKKLSEEHKEKLREMFSDEKNPMYGKNGVSSPAFGRKDTDEQRRQKSIRMQGNTNMLGKHHSEETKRKIGDANRNPSEKTRERMSRAQKGRYVSEETRRKQSKARKGTYLLEDNPNAKAVTQYDQDGNMIKYYTCAKSASLETGISAEGINACCRGEQKTAGGYVWKR